MNRPRDRRLAAAALALLFAARLPADFPPPARGPADTHASPHAVVRGVEPGAVRWTGGFLGQRFETCRTSTLPHLWRVLRGTEYSQFLVNFRVAAGQVEGRHRGAAFNDGEVYKWLEAAVAVSAVAPDPGLTAAVDEAIAAIRAAQRPDGYLHARTQLRQRDGDANARPFRDPLQFEAYCLGHLMAAACAHHRATGKNDLLDVARKAGDFLDRAAREPTPEFARCAICPSHYIGLVELYRTTREPRYLDLAKKLIALRDTVRDGTDDNQDRLPLRQHTKAHGHAVRANYLYAGAADLYAETGDRTLLAPLTAVWNDLVTTKLAITGGCGALFDGASPDGSKDQRQIGRVHQAYGREYQLPQSAAHNETCAAVGLALWSGRMLAITGEAKYADVLEQVLYNALPAGVSLDGTKFFYTNTLRQLDRMPADLRWPRERQPYLSSFCCPPNLARTFAQVARYAYGTSDRGVWVHLYGASELTTDLPTGGPLTLTQTTDYPWDGKVRLTVTVDRPATFSVFLRIPAWAAGRPGRAGSPTVAVNGTATAEPPVAGTYFEVRRAWSAGDVVELALPLHPRLLESHPLVEETRNHVAVQRGPVVYCLESPDLPAGVRVGDVAIPAAIDLRPRADAGLPGGVTVLEGRAVAYPARDWARELYRELAPTAPKPIDLRLIPYYAWANRGQSEMSVWLPLLR